MVSRRLFGLIGRPVIHSLSPAMHAAAFRARHLEADYVRVLAEEAAEALALCRSAGFAGFNVTAPFKETISGCVSAQPLARRVGAVNTVLMRRGRAVGFNTDVAGLRRALEASRVPLRGRSVLLLGAGGAARAAAFALVEAGALVTIANRTVERARTLARELGCEAIGLERDGLRGRAREAQVVVGATSGRARLLEPGWLDPGATVLDAVYGWRTPLVSAAGRRGCRIVDGREWLLYQGAEAFELFTGEKAPVAAMRRAVYPRVERNRPDGIALVGFMAAGKSSVAGEVARASRLTAVDVDRRIEEREGEIIPEIFRSRGEAAFRRLERREIAALSGERRSVVAAGGGAVLEARNVAALRRERLAVWLWVDPKTAVARIEDGSRPLLTGRRSAGAARRLLDDRRDAYAGACDVLVSTEGRSPERVAALVLECFEEVSRR